jgi:hypothetical protein
MNVPTQFRNFIREELEKGILAIRFTKVNGETRTISATLNDKYLPDRMNYGSGIVRSPDVQPIWDIDEQAWKSFRWDSLLNVAEIVPVGSYLT